MYNLSYSEVLPSELGHYVLPLYPWCLIKLHDIFVIGKHQLKSLTRNSCSLSLINILLFWWFMLFGSTVGVQPWRESVCRHVWKTSFPCNWRIYVRNEKRRWLICRVFLFVVANEAVRCVDWFYILNRLFQFSGYFLSVFSWLFFP